MLYQGPLRLIWRFATLATGGGGWAASLPEYPAAGSFRWVPAAFVVEPALEGVEEPLIGGVSPARSGQSGVAKKKRII
jgi:hypothetical protein